MPNQTPNDLNPDQKKRLLELFAAGSDLEPAQRPAFCKQACGDDPVLRAELEALLQADGVAGAFLVEPVMPSGLLGHHERGEHEREGHEAAGPNLAPALGDAIGPYQIVELIGEGGMGAVYRARQVEPVERDVALKVIRPGMASREVLARFDAERQALTRMEHPGIARLYEAGSTSQGLPWFAMELVAGPRITTWCQQRELPIGARLELLCAVCDAVQHAHQKGILHRDLKPSNILVAIDERGDGMQAAPKIIDFGIARALEEPLTDATLTRAGQIVGTPDYMSPEQLADDADVDSRTDVYALGVLMYELLTGSRPFAEDAKGSRSIAEVWRTARERTPTKPSTRIGRSDPQAARRLRGDLDWIAQRALEAERERRYATPAELAADLRRHLAHQPVHAAPPSLGYRFSRFVRRNRVAVAAGVAVVLSLVAGTVTSLRFAFSAAAERDAKGVALREADERVAQLLDLTTHWWQWATVRGERSPRGTPAETWRLVGELLRECDASVAAELAALQNGMIRSPGARRRNRAEAVRLLCSLRPAPESPAALAVAMTLSDKGRDALFDGLPVDGLPALERAEGLLQHLPLEDARLQWTRMLWLDSLLVAGRAAEAAALSSEWLAEVEVRPGLEQHQVLAMHRLRAAAIGVSQGELTEARRLLDSAEPLLEQEIRNPRTYDRLEAVAIRIRLADALARAAAECGEDAAAGAFRQRAAELRELLAERRLGALAARHDPHIRLLLGDGATELWSRLLELRRAVSDPSAQIQAQECLDQIRDDAVWRGLETGSAVSAMLGTFVTDLAQGAGNVHGRTSPLAMQLTEAGVDLLRPAGPDVRHAEFAWALANLTLVSLDRSEVDGLDPVERKEALRVAESSAREALRRAPPTEGQRSELEAVCLAGLGMALAIRSGHEPEPAEAQALDAEAEALLLRGIRRLWTERGPSNGNVRTWVACLLAMWVRQGRIESSELGLDRRQGWRDHPALPQVLGTAEPDRDLRDRLIDRAKAALRGGESVGAGR